MSTGGREKQIGAALTAPVVLQWKTLTAMRLEVNRNSRAETIFMTIYKNTGLKKYSGAGELLEFGVRLIASVCR